MRKETDKERDDNEGEEGVDEEMVKTPDNSKTGSEEDDDDDWGGDGGGGGMG